MLEKKAYVSRVTRSKEAAKANYDKLSRVYDLLAAPSEAMHRKLGLEMLDAEEGEAVLEIGLGTGHALVELARAVGPSGEVVGLDISAGMLRQAERRLRKAKLLDQVELKLGDAASLPFEDQHFDALFACFTLELFDTPEIPLVLAECRRVLKGGGRLCVVALSRPHSPGRLTALSIYEWAHRRWPSTVDCRPIYLRAAIEQAGFEIVEARRSSMWGLPVEAVLGRRLK